MNKIKVVLVIISVLFIKAVIGQSYLEFVENKGQWQKNIAFQGNLINGAFAVKTDGAYRMLLYNQKDLNAVAEYFHPTKGHENAATNPSNLVLRSHAFEVKFLNGNPTPEKVAENMEESYNNYFIGKDVSKWAAHCHIYTAVTYKNIYPNIDVRYYTGNEGLKYDFIVHPGGDPNKIILYFEGVDELSIKKNSLNIKTSVDNIQQAIPSAYNVTPEGRKEVDASFKLEGSFARLKLEHYDTSTTLVIDPTLIFSTFTGSRVDEWGYTATYDDAGNFYSGGIVFGNGFPVSNGAFQNHFAGGNSTNDGPGGFDIGIMKFNPTGAKRVYSTYLGGSGNEQPHSLIVDAAGELIIAGRTTSRNFPTTYATVGAGGGWDITLSKLNKDGTVLMSSLVIGGSGDDGLNIREKYTPPFGTESLRRNYGDDARSEVVVDSSGNIYMVACTQSVDFPVSKAIQNQSGSLNTTGRKQDAVVMKFTNDLASILFCTYLGGSGDDAAYVIAISPVTKYIYIAGGTTSKDFPADSLNVIFPKFQGGTCDGFITEMANDGSKIIKSIYLGTSGADNIYGIQFDKLGFPYIMGTTSGSWPIVSPSVGGNFFQQTGKQFIAKLDADLTKWIYSTTFGNGGRGPNISPTAFLVDKCENVYVSGWGGGLDKADGYDNVGTLGLSVTKDAFKSKTDGSDFYFFVLERNAQSQLFGSYFGQDDNANSIPDHVDGGTSRFDKNGIIYQAICANCAGGTFFPTTPGVWSQSNGALGSNNGQCNLAAVKIAFNLSGLSSGIKAILKKTTTIPVTYYGCSPLTAVLMDSVGNGKRYVWNFGDGSPSRSTVTPNTTYTYNAVGTYKAMMVAIDSNSCNTFDTSYTTISVRNDEAFPALKITKQDTCTLFKYSFDNTASIAATGKPFTSNSFTLDFGDGNTIKIGTLQTTHSYAAPGLYNVKLILTDVNYCNAPDTIIQQLRVAELVKAKIATDSIGCMPYSAILSNASTGGQQFTWDFGDKSPISTSADNIHIYKDTGKYLIRLIANDTFTCNKIDTFYFTITVYPKPTTAFNISPQPPMENRPIYFYNSSLDASYFKWIYGDGDTLITTKDTTVNHLYNNTIYYKAGLISFNKYGCSDTVWKDLKALVNPLFDVPSAFTPNGNGVNDMVFVKGFGIGKMNFKIYNRWGVKVFETEDPSKGWDGTYNGKAQPQEVYHYFLNIEMTNGKKFANSGDITLIR